MYTKNQLLGWAGLLGLGLFTASTVCAQGNTFTQIQRGRYLTKLGDCVACHTAKGGKPFAGGFPITTPFGTIYSTNITPDPETGIGDWSSADFYRAMHTGVRPDGKYLYPAFPYPWFTKMSRSDVDAIKAYLDIIEPVKQENRENDLPWPLSWRGVMAGWNLLFFHEGQYKPNPSKSDVWNRGAYIVEGPGHCAACHTPKNMFGASSGGEHLQGGDAGESWYAPNLASDSRDGIGGWSEEEIVEYLKTGSNDETATAGPMTDVVMNSTRYFSGADLAAVAVYLRDLPASGVDESAEKPEISEQVMTNGKGIYMDQCIGCHLVDGKGQAKTFPPLAGSASIQANDPASLIQVVLAGERMAATPHKPTGLAMPAFGWKLNDKQVADLLNYVRNSWGNQGTLVDSDQVAEVRDDVKKYRAAVQAPIGPEY